ncbi:MAG TPA: dTDP-4-dehydrorhamnose 3,5-epimerase [Victivallales bacterium]|nr:dTDP-4-dehydrorhamnose 3,5-epimerase [Victivallales bacterium]
MKVSTCKLDGILVIEPTVFDDNRGFFLESYNRKKYEDIGIGAEFVQDNHSASTKGTLRGLHYQLNPGQSKLIRATLGEVFDVVVDVRKKSPTFGQWESFIITAENKKQVFIPRGFAHGFCVLSDYAEFLYKCDEYYSPKDERGFLWDDPEININWPISDPILSKRDLSHPSFKKLSDSDFF